jgi:hypothetical protein
VVELTVVVRELAVLPALSGPSARADGTLDRPKTALRRIARRVRRNETTFLSRK